MALVALVRRLSCNVSEALSSHLHDEERKIKFLVSMKPKQDKGVIAGMTNLPTQRLGRYYAYTRHMKIGLTRTRTRTR